MKLSLVTDTLSETLIVSVSNIPQKLASQAISTEEACGAYDGLEVLVGDELRANTACLVDGSHMGPVIEYAGSLWYAPTSDFDCITKQIVNEGFYTFSHWKQEDHE